jgi:hypothetical protein
VILFPVTTAYSQQACHQDLFTSHQAISALVEESVRAEMSPRDDAATQRND